MRFLPLLLLGAAALTRAASAVEWDEEDTTKEPTYFNGIRVPPLLELTPENFAEAVESTTHMLIKHYRLVVVDRISRRWRIADVA